MPAYSEDPIKNIATTIAGVRIISNANEQMRRSCGASTANSAKTGAC